MNLTELNFKMYCKTIILLSLFLVASAVLVLRIRAQWVTIPYPLSHIRPLCLGHKKFYDFCRHPNRDNLLLATLKMSYCRRRLSFAI